MTFYETRSGWHSGMSRCCAVVGSLLVEVDVRLKDAMVLLSEPFCRIVCRACVECVYCSF
jgi:hypothetical protein